MLGSRGHVTEVINCYILILWGWVISIRTTDLNSFMIIFLDCLWHWVSHIHLGFFTKGQESGSKDRKKLQGLLDLADSTDSLNEWC